MRKDLILIVGGGGMSGVFSSGVLTALEREDIYARVHSIYAVSVGACTAARFLERRSRLGGETFWTRFSDKRFMTRRFVRYFFHALWYGKKHSDRIDPLVNMRYFTDVILHSKERVDMATLKKCGIPFFVKVFDCGRNADRYIRVQGLQAYEQILASASMTPLTPQGQYIDGTELFDGDTIPSPHLEERVAAEHPDMLVLHIRNRPAYTRGIRASAASLIVSLLLSRLYGIAIARRYRTAYRAIRMQKPTPPSNLIIVENKQPISRFCGSAAALQDAFRSGIESGEQLVERLRTASRIHPTHT